MFNRLRSLGILILCNLLCSQLLSQTSWVGSSSTNWTTASNWTAGVPTSSIDVIIGDVNFTGINQPTINSTAACKSIVLGGAVASTLTIPKNLTVAGSITINANGNFSHGNASVTLSGNFINNGIYTATHINTKLVFGGVSQTIGGTVITDFNKVVINTGSTVTLARNITLSGNKSSLFIYGTLDPAEAPTYTVTSSKDFTIYENGKIKVNAALFTGNYLLSGTVSLLAGSIVEYSATTINQTISNSFSYSTLLVSGTSRVKSLAGSLPALNATSAITGNIFVNSGTLDLLGFTANRGNTVVGGEINIANDAFLKIGGTNTFPVNYNTRSLSLNSTVEYNGTAQTVTSLTYGNLILSAATGAVTKTFTVTGFTIEGDFTTTIGGGTSVAITSGAGLIINGNVNIGASTSFNGSSHTHTIRGNWVNNGSFSGSTGTIILDGANTSISGSGIHNFNNISFSSTGITVAAAVNISVSGNLSTIGVGQFTHAAGGTLTMSGSSKTISGLDIIFNNLAVTGSVTTISSFTINENLIVTGSFTATAGAVTMTGTAKTISGAGTIGFSSLLISGTVTTAINFSVAALLDIGGSFSATAGTITFTGNSILNGTANLYNITINGTSFQLSAASILGVANNFTITAGVLNVSSSTPNTVNFNGTGAQTVNAITYHHVTCSNGNTKTAAGAITVNGNLNIAVSTSFNGGSFTHSVLRNWVNQGTYIASTGNVQFTGANNATITGATTFNIVTLNKSSATNTLTLANNISVATLNMTTGTMRTASNAVTITTTRTGNGIILGTITRTHLFITGIAYAFEGPANTISFLTLFGITSVTVMVTKASIVDFPDGAAINREYSISIPSGTYMATLRLHYEDADLNGNDESLMTLWRNQGAGWIDQGKSGNNTTTNYIEQNGLNNITQRWTCAKLPGVARWSGAISSDWNNAANWSAVSGTPSVPPSVLDVVQIGTAVFTNPPTISTAVNVKSINFGSVQPAILTIAPGGSLTTVGNISGSWSANATHTINTGNQVLTVGGNMVLSNGIANQSINLNIGSGETRITEDLVQAGNAMISFTDAGILKIGEDYNYSGGIFTPGIGTVVYDGNGTQLTAPLNYNNLTINKAAGLAALSSNINIGGNLLINAGIFNIVNATISITGNSTIGSGTTLDCDAVTLNVAGNWTNNGTYKTTSGTVSLNGTSTQTISAGNFNHLIINKTAGSAILAGNNLLEGNLTLQLGTLDLSTFLLNRTTSGGIITLAAGTSMFVSGSNNFPAGFSSRSISANSLVHYNGTIAQSVAGNTYGNIMFSNGGASVKTLNANAIISGNFSINNAAILHSGGNAINLTGNWTNNGGFTASSGTVLLNGSGKIIAGATTFNQVIVNGSYTVDGSNITYNGHFQVTGTGVFAAGNGTATVNADLTNSGTLTSDGITNFSGSSLQNIRLINALSSSSTGVVNFNGSVSPVLNSTSSPQFATLNINNTAGINPSVDWTVFVGMNVNSGGKFNGGLSTHTIVGSFTNNGLVTSTGTINFAPSSAKTINFGATGFSSTGIIRLGGTGQISIAGTPVQLRNVIISNTNSAGVTPPSGWVIDSSFVVTSNSKFNAGSYTYTIGGNIESDGILTGGSSTFNFTSSAGLLTASAQTEFNHLIITGNLTPQTDFRVAGNFTNNGTYDGSIGVLIMTGSNAAVIAGITAPSPIAQLTIEKSGNAIVTQNVNISNVLFMNIFSGIHFTSTNTITQDAGGGILIINAGATLRLGGTNSLPAFIGYGLDKNSNVDYAGTNQIVANAAIYGNLLITAAGTKNATIPFITQGNLLISNGTLATLTLSVTHNIAGDFIMTGGSITGSSSTYELNGTADQTLTLLSNLVNLTVNKTGGNIILGSDVTINNVTNFLSGKINNGNYNYSVSSTGSISNYNTSKYFITTGSGSLIQQVSAGGSKIFPVGLSNYYLPATVALTAGSVSDVFLVRLLTSVYTQGASGTVVTSKAVNATWMIAEAVAGGSVATITLQWNPLLEMTGFNRNFSRLAHHTAGSWNYGPSDIAASGANPYFISRSGFTSFSPFAISMLDALPVTWLSITGNHNNNSNTIYWSTATEINNNYFTIEASKDGVNFNAIGKINAAGNSFTVQQYTLVHTDINGEIYFYRIKQTDIDGKFSFSKTIKIMPETITAARFSFYPNPIAGSGSLYLSIQTAGNYFISILNMEGNIVYKQNYRLPKGVSILPIDMSAYQAGVYHLLIRDEMTNRQTIRLVKQ